MFKSPQALVTQNSKIVFLRSIEGKSMGYINIEFLYKIMDMAKEDITHECVISLFDAAKAELQEYLRHQR